MLIRSFQKWEGAGPYFLPVVLFTAIAIVGIFISSATPAEKIYDLGRMRFFLYLWGLYTCLKFHIESRRWFWTLAVSSTIVAVYAGIQHFVPMDLVRPEASKVILYAIPEQKIGPLSIGTFNHHLTYSNIFILYACLFGAVGIQSYPKNRWLLFSTGLILLTCIWTNSRTAWFCVPLVAVLLAWSR